MNGSVRRYYDVGHKHGEIRVQANTKLDAIKRSGLKIQDVLYVLYAPSHYTDEYKEK